MYRRIVFNSPLKGVWYNLNSIVIIVAYETGYPLFKLSRLFCSDDHWGVVVCALTPIILILDLHNAFS